MLSKDQMKQIIGGLGVGGEIKCNCNSGDDCSEDKKYCIACSDDKKYAGVCNKWPG